MPEPQRTQSSRPPIYRSTLIRAVADAAQMLWDPDDREAVLEYAERATLVVAGAWSLKTSEGGTCRCPVSAVGIDRLREDANEFAERFDSLLVADPEVPILFEVVADA